MDNCIAGLLYHHHEGTEESDMLLMIDHSQDFLSAESWNGLQNATQIPMEVEILMLMATCPSF